MIEWTHLEIIIAVTICTFLTRCAAFLLFPASRPVPGYIRFLGKTLPQAITGILIIYWLRDTRFTDGGHGLPELAAGTIVIVMHHWKKNILLSTVTGTTCYMLIRQFIPLP